MLTNIIRTINLLTLAFVFGGAVWFLFIQSSALGGALINHFFVVPRALKPGGRSLREEVTGDEQKSVTRFASEGGGEATRFWHRVLVLLVVVMPVGIVLHAYQLVTVLIRLPLR